MLVSWLRALRSTSLPTPSATSAAQHPSVAELEALRSRVTLAEERVAALERKEVTRAAEHADQLQQLESLYRRMSTRIQRAQQKLNGAREGDESTLDLRNRLGR